jgi:hypothetical protein
MYLEVFGFFVSLPVVLEIACNAFPLAPYSGRNVKGLTRVRDLDHLCATSGAAPTLPTFQVRPQCTILTQVDVAHPTY